MTAIVDRPRTPNRVRIGLGLLEAFIGLNAIWGGVALITDAWTMPAEWLERTPFDSWVLPGVALLVIIAGSQLAAAFMLLTNRPGARTVSIASGGVLMGWIVVQLALLQRFHPVMHPTLFAAGCLIVFLAWRLPRHPSEAAGSRPEVRPDQGPSTLFEGGTVRQSDGDDRGTTQSLGHGRR